MQSCITNASGWDCYPLKKRGLAPKDKPMETYWPDEPTVRSLFTNIQFNDNNCKDIGTFVENLLISCHPFPSTILISSTVKP